jgi:hypothetical protein
VDTREPRSAAEDRRDFFLVCGAQETVWRRVVFGLVDDLIIATGDSIGVLIGEASTAWTGDDSFPAMGEFRTGWTGALAMGDDFTGTGMEEPTRRKRNPSADSQVILI